MKYYDTLVERMSNYYTSLVSSAPDQASDVMIRIRVLAAQLSTYCEEAEEAARQAFPTTATGEALEHHAALRGLSRKEGAKAVGVISFRRSTPAGYQIIIPAGTVIQSEGEETMQFVTVQNATMSANGTSTIAQVEAVEPGSQYNLKAGSLTVMVTPPPGITQMTQVTDCMGGADPESDEDLRARLLESCRNPVIGGNAGFYQGLVLAQSGVAKAKVLPVQRGNGTLDIVVYGKNGGLGTSRIAAIQQAINKERDLGVDVLVRDAQTVPMELILSIAVKDGWDYSTVSATCKSALEAEINSLGIGEPWLLARIYRVVMSQEGVYNCVVSTPTADVIPAADKLLIKGYFKINQMEVG